MDKNIQECNSISKVEQEKLQRVVDQMLAYAKQQGATAAEVSASTGVGLSTCVRLGEVDTVEFNRSKGISVTAYIGQRKGHASSSDLSSEAVLATVKAACDIARVTEEDPYAGLAAPELMAYNYPDLQLYYPWQLSGAEAIELARECERLARAEDKRIVNSDGVSVSAASGYCVYGNSHGFIGSYPTSSHHIGCSLVAKEKDELQRAYYSTVARDSHDLESISAVAKEAARRTIARLGGRKLATMQAPVMFHPEMAKGLWNHFISAIKGGNLYRRATFLVDSLQQQIFPSFVHIYEDPLIIKGNASAPFDAEGVRTQKKDFIQAGVLQNYVLASYSARRLGMTTTGNAGGVRNLFVEPGAYDRQALLKEMGRGLFVTELMGQGVNIITGDYSRGAAGFWVEDGEIQYPVEEITIAGNLRDIFLNIKAVANDIDARSNIQTGSVLVDNMMIAGT